MQQAVVAGLDFQRPGLIRAKDILPDASEGGIAVSGSSYGGNGKDAQDRDPDDPQHMPAPARERHAPVVLVVVAIRECTQGDPKQHRLRHNEVHRVERREHDHHSMNAGLHLKLGRDRLDQRPQSERLNRYEQPGGSNCQQQRPPKPMLALETHTGVGIVQTPAAECQKQRAKLKRGRQMKSVSRLRVPNEHPKSQAQDNNEAGLKDRRNEKSTSQRRSRLVPAI